MYALMIYSLKVGACLAVFYLFFKLLLSRETLYKAAALEQVTHLTDAVQNLKAA